MESLKQALAIMTWRTDSFGVRGTRRDGVASMILLSYHALENLAMVESSAGIADWCLRTEQPENSQKNRLT